MSRMMGAVTRREVLAGAIALPIAAIGREMAAAAAFDTPPPSPRTLSERRWRKLGLEEAGDFWEWLRESTTRLDLAIPLFARTALAISADAELRAAWRAAREECWSILRACREEEFFDTDQALAAYDRTLELAQDALAGLPVPHRAWSRWDEERDGR